MIALSLLIGIIPPSIVGWLTLDLIEGKTHVLWRGEKWALGFVLGLTLSMFCAFLANETLGMEFTLWGFLEVFAVLVIVLSGANIIRKKLSGSGTGSGSDFFPSPSPSPSTSAMSRTMILSLALITCWVLLRTLTFGSLSFLTPSFFDDSMDNWNLRGRVFYEDRTLRLIFPWDQNAQGVSSYPPTVSLSKTWLATINGQWDDHLANTLHPVWFLSLLLLLYWTLRRQVPRLWAILGTVMLASLPLELIQGTNAYADVFLSVHLFAVAALLMRAVACTHRNEHLTWLRLSLFALALLPFTKNEGWALYFPILLFLTAASGWWMWRKRMVETASLIRTAAMGVTLIAIVAGSWIGFKLLHDLSFGNAKTIDLNFRWQPGVVLAITVNTFLEGNWSLLFPLFFGLLLYRWKTAFRTPLFIFTAFFLIPYVGQLFAYLFTGLSQEALFQTGYARGLIHLMPVIVTVTTVLLYDAIYRDKGTEGAEGTKGTKVLP